MRIQVRETPIKAVLFYVSKEEAENKELINSLNPQFDSWKSKGYFPAVFESGEGSLEDGMYMLMKYNMELIAKKRRERSR